MTTKKKTMEHANIETAQKWQHKNPTNPRQHKKPNGT